MMRLLVDLLGVQVEMARGLHPAGLSVVQSLWRQREDVQVSFLLCASLPETVVPLRRALAREGAGAACRVWHGAPSREAFAAGDDERARVTARIRAAFVASLAPDVVCIVRSAEDRGLDVPVAAAAALPHVAVVGLAPPFGAAEDAARDVLLRCAMAQRPPSADAPLAADGAPGRPLRLAYVCPLPPERTGIADYSAEVLPALARHYAVDVVVAQPDVSDAWIAQHCAIRTVEWFREHAPEFDRVLYHFGNSEFHRHMFGLLEDIPGVVVLHDFYLGHLQAFREAHSSDGRPWIDALFHSHGYKALLAREKSAEAAKWDYPVNLQVLQRATGLIAHSRHVEHLARDWYESVGHEKWAVVPLPRRVPAEGDRDGARRALGISAATFVVCSFGALGPSKLNRRLLDAWLQGGESARDGLLVYVGADPGGEHAHALLEAAREAGAAATVIVTGWVDAPAFRAWLRVADVAVQLRGSTRGESSAAVLDCMAQGVPTIVNANGAIAEIDPEAVVMLPDAFEDAQLAEAIARLRASPAQRRALGERARAAVVAGHDVSRCAEGYFQAIECFARSPWCTLLDDLGATVRRDDAPSLVALAGGVSATFPFAPRPRQLLVDVSITCREDLRTGIQRAVRALVVALVGLEGRHWRLEPVYASEAGGRWQYRYARTWTSGLLRMQVPVGGDDPVDAAPGDVFLAADLATPLVPVLERANVLRDLSIRGVDIAFVVYDLLPMLLPHMFPPERRDFHDWFSSVGRVADRLVCISRSVATEVTQNLPTGLDVKPTVHWFHLGGDMENSAPSRGLSAEAASVAARLTGRRSFLMVGTIEPRKGHLLVLEAFEQLWSRDVDVDLVIVGAEGWRSVPEGMRRTIPHLVQRLRHHPQRGERLFWVQEASDESLECLYEAATCLVAASEGEGFGLPLVEGARRGLPIIARDIPVFREVAGEHAYFFQGDGPEALAASIEAWLALHAVHQHPRSDAMGRLTWEESARQLLEAIGLECRHD